MNLMEFKDLIKKATYKTKYEPLICSVDDSIYGYEALSKFEIDEAIINTEEIFRRLHHNNNLFFELEKRNKQLQINNFFENKKLFLNFDADIVNSIEQKNYWEKLLKGCDKNIVVEITENGSDDEKSMQIIHNFSSWLKEKGISSALDDFGKEGSMFSFFLMDKSKYIKVDKSFLKQIKKSPNYIEYLKGILKTIKLNNQYSIIEGIETAEDYNFAKELGFDYMQGYFFNNFVVIR